MIRVLFFGKLSDFAKPLEIAIPDGVATVEDLVDWLMRETPVLREALDQPGVKIAVNQQFSTTGQRISDGDEIAFMSPLSGG